MLRLTEITTVYVVDLMAPTVRIHSQLVGLGVGAKRPYSNLVYICRK